LQALLEALLAKQQELRNKTRDPSVLADIGAGNVKLAAEVEAAKRRLETLDKDIE